MTRTLTKSLRFAAGACVGAALGVGVCVSAAPLDPGLVHADAGWVVHIDTESVNASTFSAKAKELDPAGATEDSKAFQDSFGLDPETDLFGLTIYGGDEGPQDAVVVADVRAQAAEALPRFLESKRVSGLAKFDEGGKTLHRWTLEGRPFVMLMGPGVNESRRRVYVGPTSSAVLRASRVADGELASQKSLKAPTLPTQPASGTFAYIAVRGDAGGQEGDANAALFRSAKSVVVELGESVARTPEPAQPAQATSPADATQTAPKVAPNDAPKSDRAVYLDVVLTASTPETATQLGQVVQGLASFARLRVAEQKNLGDVVQMLDQMRVTVDANAVRVHAACPSDTFARVLVDPQVETYVRTLVPSAGGPMGLPGSKGEKPPAPTVPTSGSEGAR